MLDPSLYDPEFLANIKRAADAGLSHASSTSEFVATEPAGDRIRKDRAEVAWFRECSDSTKGFEHFANSGAERFMGVR